MRKKRQRRERRRDGTGIAYQNKDIASKLFTERLKGDVLEVCGLKNADVKELGATNMPIIESNELRMDILFIMGDGSYAIVDYESEYSAENKSKYLNYIARVSKRLYTEFGEYKRIRMMVIYTADVEECTTDPVLDIGTVRMETEEAFLIGLDSEKIKEELTGKNKRGESFTDADIMKLAIYPLTFKGRIAQQRAVTEAIDIAEAMVDDELKKYAESGIFVFSDKIITDKDAERIIGRLSMTKIERLFQEKEDKAVAKAREETRKADRKEAKEEKKQSAIKFLKTGVSIEKVSECMGLTLKEVQALAAKV